MGSVSIQGTSFSIYGTYAGALEYFKASLPASITAWTAAGQVLRQQALVTASRMIDRVGLIDPATGLAITAASVTQPAPTQFAGYELAAALLADPSVQTVVAAGSNVRRTHQRDKVGDLESESETEYFRSTLGVSGRFPTIVQELLGPYLAGGADALSSAYVYGTAESEFLDAGFELNLGGYS